MMQIIRYWFVNTPLQNRFLTHTHRQKKMQKTIPVGDGTLIIAGYGQVWYQNDGQDVCFPIYKRKAIILKN